jgi:hypothetical protein
MEESKFRFILDALTFFSQSVITRVIFDIFLAG